LIGRWFIPLNETNDLDKAAAKREFDFSVGWYICSTDGLQNIMYI